MTRKQILNSYMMISFKTAKKLTQILKFIYNYITLNKHLLIPTHCHYEKNLI